jgi:hypothetical protein
MIEIIIGIAAFILFLEIPTIKKFLKNLSKK